MFLLEVVDMISVGWYGETFINSYNCINRKFNKEFRNIRTVQIIKLRRLLIDRRTYSSEYEDIVNDTDIMSSNEVKHMLSLGPNMVFHTNALSCQFQLSVKSWNSIESYHIRAYRIKHHYQPMGRGK